MDESEAQRQIQQMVNFILNEAKDKAEEIEAKSLEDFNIEKLKLVQQMKDKVRQDYQKKAKQMETQRQIARSTAINKARLKKISARNHVIEEVSASAGHELAKMSSGGKNYPSLLVELTVQALLALLEEEVYVRCREEDKGLMKEVFEEASAKYSSVVQEQSGVAKKVRIHIDRENPLPPSPGKNSVGRTCLGGVTVTTMDRKIVVDNTLDTRLNLVVSDCLPEIRKILFPEY